MLCPMISLAPLSEADRSGFVRDVQSALEASAISLFGAKAGEVVPESDVEESLNAKGAQAFRLLSDGVPAGGAVLIIDALTRRNRLELFFVGPAPRNRGLGLAAWKAIEEKFPDTEIWETITPYYEKRNIHFYVNKCGFKIVEFFNPYHRDPVETKDGVIGRDYYFRFEKDMTEAR